MVNRKYTKSETDGKDKWEMSHLWSTLKSNRSTMHILCPLLRLIKHNAGISHSSPSRYSSFSNPNFPLIPLYLLHKTTWIRGKCRISGKMLISLECAISVWSSLQFATVVGIVFSLLPLRFSSSKCSSLLSLLKGKQKNTISYRQELVTFWTSLLSSQSTAPQKNSCWYYVVFKLERQCDILVKRSR